jgi:GDSL-like Lipase/Acylhydrolase family
VPIRDSAALRGAAVRLVLSALAFPLVACGPGEEATGGPVDTAVSTTAGSGGSAAGEVDLAVVGDSLTAAGDTITTGTAISDGDARPGDTSWLSGAGGPPLVIEGGWARDGATTADMLRGVAEYDAPVLVVLAGTNDLLQGVPWERTRENLLDIVERAGVDRVVLSAVPPLDRDPQAPVGLNPRLADLAENEGWQFVDPWTDFASDGSFRPGSSADGVHPTSMVAFAVGRTIRQAVLGGAGG